MRGMPEDRAMRDLKAAFDYLASRDDVDASRRSGRSAGAWEAAMSLALAIEEPKLAACVVNYGRLVTDPATIAKIQAPLLGNFGAEDQGIPPASVEEFQKAARAAGKSVDFKIYAGAGHGFASLPDSRAYRPTQARDADARVNAFLEKNLKGMK